MKKIAGAFVGVAAVVVFACGGQERFACGSTTCAGDELCMHPCCGGAPPPCVAADDAGTCPYGNGGLGYCSNYTTATPCTPAPCTPPPPYCAPKGTFCEAGQGDSQNCYEGCA
jgi:hypothetical protein